MSHLIEEYAKSCGVKIGEPVLNPHFVPIPFEKYVSFYSSPIQAKNYAYWGDVLSLVKPSFERQGIKIVQILDQDQVPVVGVDFSIYGSYKQISFVISRCTGFFGVDSFHLHCASHFDKPIVGVFSNTNPNNCGPIWSKKNVPIIIESPKNGKKPSYSHQEMPKTIDGIMPEEIAQKILDSLNIDYKITRKTLYIGPRYLDQCLDIIPTLPTHVTAEHLNVRMDIFPDEKVLREVLMRNFAEVTTSSVIPDDILNMRRIGVINYVAPKFNVEFVEKVRSLGITLNLLCSSKSNLPSERLKLFDFSIIDFDIKEKKSENDKKLNFDALKKFNIKSNKKIVCGNVMYDSLFHYTKGSKDAFLLDLEWYMVYTD